MLPLKRKRISKEEYASSENGSFSGSDSGSNGSRDGSDEEMEFIQSAIAKRNAKDGTDLLKKTSKVKGKGKAKGEIGGGSFQAMGLHPSLLRALTLRGFKTPTPIQRATLPLLLQNPPKDLVAMARTGSGKTLAYLIPLLNRLNNRHSTTYGARALILVPSRELALQVLKVGKELGRGWKDEGEGTHAGEKEASGNSGIRWALVVGGEGLDEQFETMANNPDIIIATPGRLLHLLTEMSLTLSTLQYLVFDEADSLFSTLAPHINTLLSYLPTQRQTLLFSATLPKSIVEFAKAGLREPKLVRLDSEMKLSGDLRCGFWWVREGERVAALLGVLQLIGVPNKEQNEASQPTDEGKKKKEKKLSNTGSALLPSTSTIIFTSTQHHVSYLAHLLGTLPIPYAVSAIHGSLPQPSRVASLALFAQSKTNILVTTDVAARGLDLPGVGNVINFDFPVGERAFIHRVGRTARAGRSGWAWSLVGPNELPYLLDLQLFLARPLAPASSLPHLAQDDESIFTEQLVLGTFPRTILDAELETIKGMEEKDYELVSIRGVMERAIKAYERTRAKASGESYTRGKELMKQWSSEIGENPIWRIKMGISEDRLSGSKTKEVKSKDGRSREDLLKALAGFKPSETVFEIGSRGKTAGASLMKERRKAMEKSLKRKVVDVTEYGEESSEHDGEESDAMQGVEIANEDDIINAFGSKGKNKSSNFKDKDYYLGYKQKDADTERGYSLHKDSGFLEQAPRLTLDLPTDDSGIPLPGVRKAPQLKWDKKKKNFVKSTVGADNVKYVKTEGGVKMPVSYKSGRYEEWIKGAGRGREIKIGETEKGGNTRGMDFGKKYRHNKVVDAKPLDRYSNDYDRKIRVMKKKQGSNGEDEEPGAKGKKGYGGKPLKGARWKGKTPGQVKNELKNVHQIRKQRNLLEKRRAKNARAPKKGKGGR